MPPTKLGANLQELPVQQTALPFFHTTCIYAFKHALTYPSFRLDALFETLLASDQITMAARTRLFKEIKDVARTKEETGIELIPDDMNIFVWRALIKVGDEPS